MSASLQPLTLEEFLDWERSQPQRYEFDGVQPIAMTGGRAHSRIATRTAAALVFQVKPPCEAYGPQLKVITTGRVRYPDASVVCRGSGDDDDDTVASRAVFFEVVSPPTDGIDATLDLPEIGVTIPLAFIYDAT